MQPKDKKPISSMSDAGTKEKALRYNKKINKIPAINELRDG